MKVPHLRNMYQKVGMFGMAAVPFFNPGDNAHKGDQIRGFGFLHDGSTDTPFRFFQAGVFNQSSINPTGIPPGPTGQTLRRQLEALSFEFDSNLKPIVGQQATVLHSSCGSNMLSARKNSITISSGTRQQHERSVAVPEACSLV